MMLSPMTPAKTTKSVSTLQSLSTKGCNQHGLRDRIEHWQQGKHDETGKPALQCVALEIFAPEMPVNIQGHRLSFRCLGRKLRAYRKASRCAFESATQS